VPSLSVCCHNSHTKRVTNRNNENEDQAGYPTRDLVKRKKEAKARPQKEHIINKPPNRLEHDKKPGNKPFSSSLRLNALINLIRHTRRA
jgi:hypothetical protein